MRRSLAFFILSLAAVAMAQDGPPLTKAEERAKFHPVPVRGMPAIDRQKAYDLRLRKRAESYFSGLNWRNVGPEIQGGRIIDLEVPARDRKALYVAFATGGLYRTRDEGTTWENLFADQSSFGIGDIAVSADGKTIWVGTGENNSQRTSYAGTGVYKSTDSGKTWTNVGLPESHHIGHIEIDPRDPNTVYVAVLGHLYSQNSERGLYKTTDGGKSWSQILKVDEYTGAIDFVIDPRNPQRLLVSMWDRDRRAWNFRESGQGSAVYSTDNGGRSWRIVNGLPRGDYAGRTGLALAPNAPNVVYAFVDHQANDPEFLFADERLPSGVLSPRRFLRLSNETLKDVPETTLNDFLRRYSKLNLTGKQALDRVTSGGLTYDQLKADLQKAYPSIFAPDIIQSELYRSDDFGRTWRKQSDLGNIGGYYWGKVFVSPHDANEVYVTGVPLYRSRDAGKTWTEVATEAHVDHHAMVFDAEDPARWWVGNDGGLYRTYDSGKTVVHINNLSVAQATTLAVDNKTPYNIIIGTQDNGTIKGPSTYVPGQSNKWLWTFLFGGDGSAIAVDPRPNSELIYVAYQFGQHFATAPGEPARYITPRAVPGLDDLRFNWISPLIISPHHPDILYVGSQYVHRSLNQGRTWDVISPDLTKNRPNGDVPHSTIKELSESPFKFGVIIAGTDDGNVRITQNGGATWENADTPTPTKWVSRVIASRHKLGTFYVSQTGYREDDFAAYLWRSDDYGRTWRSIVGNLPAESINVIREDSKNADTLYVGTDMGVYVSFDAGKNWFTLGGGMPNLPVHDLVQQERADDLVAATHAQGAWVLPLKWVRRFNADLAAKAVQILDLPDIRSRANWGMPRGNRAEPLPASEPEVALTFFTNSAGRAVFRIKDKDGKVVLTQDADVVRGFNLRNLSLQLKPGTRVVTAPLPPAKTAQEALADPYASSRAQVLGVGEYTLEIEINGQSTSQKFSILAPLSSGG